MRHYDTCGWTLRDLLKLVRTIFPLQISSDIHGFTCIGVAESIQVLGQRDTEIFVWHVQGEFYPHRAELTRWSLGALVACIGYLVKERYMANMTHRWDKY